MKANGIEAAVGLLVVALTSANAAAQTASVSTDNLTQPAAARGDRFARAGNVSLSAERLFGVVWTQQKGESNGIESKASYTSVSLLANPVGGVVSAYSVPRISVDFFPIDGLSVGAALGVFTLSGTYSASGNGDSASGDLGRGTGVLVAPRVGYAIMFNDVVGLWPRAGISYTYRVGKNDDGSTKTSSNRLAIGAEAALVVTPVPHAGFSIGPTLDLGLSGSNKVESGGTTTTRDVKATDVGLQTGMFLYF